MREKDLYPAIEKFLKTQKNCVSEYVGSEFPKSGGKPRVDVFGISDEGEKIIYLCEGKKDVIAQNLVLSFFLPLKISKVLCMPFSYGH